MIPYGRQHISDADIEAVVKVLSSDFLTQGPAVPVFEEAVAAYCGTPHAVAVNSATSALHLACLALGVGKGDLVWTSPITFVASANCALYCGAKVDFVDIDRQTNNLSVERLAEKLAQASQNGGLPKVVIPVHLCGQSSDMVAIHALSKEYGFKIIEDASHAMGGKYRGEPVGNCRFSDITIFSFHPVKIITTGEGGMALTRDAALADRMKLLRSHGITRDSTQMTTAPDGPWYYRPASSTRTEPGRPTRPVCGDAACDCRKVQRGSSGLAADDAYDVRRCVFCTASVCCAAGVGPNRLYASKGI
jgi:dTDP-4-amino-4,6-dideoxygalactose transaminase